MERKVTQIIAPSEVGLQRVGVVEIGDDPHRFGGGVNIAQTKDVNLTYDQDYLKKLTKGMPDNRRRIAHLWTRSY